MDVLSRSLYLRPGKVIKPMSRLLSKYFSTELKPTARPHWVSTREDLEAIPLATIRRAIPIENKQLT